MSEKEFLNGEWDFFPLYGKTKVSDAVPKKGWEKSTCRVPSFWNSPDQGVRKKGEKYFHAFSWNSLEKTPAKCKDYENLFETHSYPPEWNLARSGWLRRSFEVKNLSKTERLIVHFDAVCARCTVFVNGRKAAFNEDAFLPFEADITDLIVSGRNELAVRIDDWETLPDSGLRLQPPGGVRFIHGLGIWQDVFLRREKAVSVQNAVIRTYVRKGRLKVLYELANKTEKPFSGPLTARILDWKTGKLLKTLKPLSVKIPANGKTEVSFKENRVDLPLWDTDSPNLEILEVRLAGGTFRERFGWREIVLDGPHVRLNGRIRHLFGDWGHKQTELCFMKAWNEAYFDMLRAANCNYTRLHAYPHPPCIMDLADEQGILLTVESAIFGSAALCGGTSPLFWKNAEKHIRRMICRDCNHPSVIAWSIENEMRWNSGNSNDLRDLQKLAKKIDPTRPSYHDGDSSQWDENEQDIISRHYGRECSGSGWWDRKHPLFSSEMANYHMAGPNNNCQLAGDEAWRDYRAVKRASAYDSAMTIEDGRVLGVAVFQPWNLSCLENYRFHGEHKFKWKDLSAPGPKPDFVHPGVSEFEFWASAGAPKFHPSEVFEIQRNACRPFALIDTSRRTGYFAGSTMTRTITLVNDLPRTVSGVLRVFVGSAELPARSFTVVSGETVAHTFTIPLPAIAGKCVYSAEFTDSNGAVIDRLERTLLISESAPLPALRNPVYVMKGPASQKLLKLIPGAKQAKKLPALPDGAVAILQPRSSDSAQDLRNELLAFTERGGKVLMLEPEVSVFPGVKIKGNTLFKAHIRNPEHPVLQDVDLQELAFWGDGAYSDDQSDKLLCRNTFPKDDGSCMIPLIDGGDGLFGQGSLENMLMFEAPAAPGTMIVSTLRLNACLDTIPAARKLLFNSLVYLDSAVPPRAKREPEILPLAEAIAKAKTGKSVWSAVATAKDSALLLRETGIRTVEKEVWNVVRANGSKSAANTCNEDGCGVVTWTYSDSKLRNVPVAARVLEAASGLTPLLETAPYSALEELFVYNGKTEPLRAYTFSRIAETPQKALVAAGSCRIGKGTLKLWQIAPGEPWPRFDRLRRTVMAAEGDFMPGNALKRAGKLVQDGKGCPESFRVCDASHMDIPALIEAALPSAEHIPFSRGNLLGDWKVVPAPDGVFRNPAFKRVAIQFYLNSPMPRPEMDPELRVPNPEAMTVCELAGTGKVRFILNGRDRGTHDLSADFLKIRDLYLSEPANVCVLVWEPGSAPELSIRFRTFFNKVESDLVFW